MIKSTEKNAHLVMAIRSAVESCFVIHQPQPIKLPVHPKEGVCKDFLTQYFCSKKAEV
jgi:hypothetical protein